MKRVGFLLKVKQERIEEYRRHHEAVWPEMLEALTRHGWRNYSLFMRDDGTMFGYFEAEDGFQASLDGMATEDVNQRWQRLMEPFFEIPSGSRPDEMRVELEEVFHVD
jgi:L-rhamnose mutarotase